MMMAQQNSRAAEILQHAAGHMIDRASTYDNERGERSIPATVEAFNAITGHDLTAEQGWLFMLILKLVRSQQGDYKADNYEDSAAYAALMGEQAESYRTVSGEQFGKDLLESVKQMDEMLEDDGVLDEITEAARSSAGCSIPPRGATHYVTHGDRTTWYMLNKGVWAVSPRGGEKWYQLSFRPMFKLHEIASEHETSKDVDWDAAEKRMDVVGQNGSHRCGHLSGEDRQLCAQRELRKISREQIESVKIALKKRANKNQ